MPLLRGFSLEGAIRRRTSAGRAGQHNLRGAARRPCVMVLHSGILPGNWREGFLSHRRPLAAGLNDQDRRRPSQVSGLMH